MHASTNAQDVLSCSFLSDIDECVDTYHGCHHSCQNTNGSYVCTCYDGFILAEDGRSCEGTYAAKYKIQ